MVVARGRGERKRKAVPNEDVAPLYRMSTFESDLLCSIVPVVTMLSYT